MPYFVYFLRCRDDSFYCGYTSDLDKRVAKHNAGTASKYTSRRLPVELIYSEEYPTRVEAMRREYACKQLSRREKEELIFHTR